MSGKLTIIRGIVCVCGFPVLVVLSIFILCYSVCYGVIVSLFKLLRSSDIGLKKISTDKQKWPGARSSKVELQHG
jgi:hypothetical protein